MSVALYTDRYELTMVQAALHSGKASRPCVFEVFSRSLPAGRRFGVLAGIDRVLDAVKDFTFDQEQLDFLASQQVVNSQTIDFLANYRFRGDIRGYREGEIYFPHSPVLTVEGSFADAVLLETVILSILNFDSAVASAGARMRAAAGSRRLIEMGGRRVHEAAAVAAARAAYLVGFDGTSNLEAGMRFGIPTFGTSAHSFTLLHDTEDQAFESQLSALGNSTTLLVDTYDVERAVRKAVELSNGKLHAVRLDSGDLVASAIEVRKLLDELGANETQITVTSDLDEYTIAALAQAPVNNYGVGTSLVTGSGSPTAGFVYKLVSHFDGENWVAMAKKSANKASRGGKKRAVRQTQGGKAVLELISDDASGRELQVSYIKNGDLVFKPELSESRTHHQLALSELPVEALRLSRGEAAIPTEFN
ncbi:nicotinate phosphoribosyltransferase [Aquiluna sp. KACHI24]|uniref:nicotinate phosphoribosyltransferase n=1 Tax=Aquiluna sp. KACHI24 TaxID=2968831 RepID=UPI0022317917|nr:nicotinate phosphoribosyltransferase [Aquiluna sp. KACHI24]